MAPPLHWIPSRSPDPEGHRSMSSIGSDPHLNVTGLNGLGGQVALDDLQGRQQQTGPQQVDALREITRAVPTAPEVDAGELVLRAQAWEGTAPGARLLSGDLAFESALGGLELSAAADRAVDAIFGELDAIA